MHNEDAMKLSPRLPRMNSRLMLGLLLLGGLALPGCASQLRTVLAPIPVASEWRDGCDPAIQPADPVTPSAALLFGQDAIVEARCWEAIAKGAIGSMDAHNERAGEQ